MFNFNKIVLATVAGVALSQQIGVAMDQRDRAELEEEQGGMRAALGDAAFEQAWAAGQALTWEDALALALAEVDRA